MLKFNVIKRKDPRDPNAKAKFYATINRVQALDTKYISKELADKSSISRGDVSSIMDNLVDLIPKELANGRSIKLGDLGTFYLNISSEGLDKASEVGPDAIRKVNIRFCPSPELKQLLGRLKYEKLEFI